MKKLSEMSLQELWQLFPIELKTYRPEYPLWFAAERERLLPALECAALDIVHVGSTAVSDLAAKPIIDMLVILKEDSVLESAADGLCEKGYLVMNRQGKRISLNLGYTENGFAERVFHAHIRYGGDVDELYFRDFLIAHPQAAAEYAALKYMLAEKFRYDRDAYTEAKAEFVLRVTAAAKEEFAGRYQ